MQWLLANWFWIVLGIALLGVHLLGHSRHGGHVEGARPLPTGDGDAEASRRRNESRSAGGHQH